MLEAISDFSVRYPVNFMPRGLHSASCSNSRRQHAGGGEQACCPVSIVHASTIDYRIYQHGPQQTHVAFSEFYCVDSTGYHVCIQSYAMVQDLMFEMLPAPELSIRVL